jgi:hypothetical protein
MPAVYKQASVHPSDLIGQTSYPDILAGAKYKIPVKLYRPILIEKNFRDGFVQRYFAKYIPAPTITITEIDEPTFKQLNKNPMYQTIEVRWLGTNTLNELKQKELCQI